MYLCIFFFSPENFTHLQGLWEIKLFPPFFRCTAVTQGDDRQLDCSQVLYWGLIKYDLEQHMLDTIHSIHPIKFFCTLKFTTNFGLQDPTSPAVIYFSIWKNKSACGRRYANPLQILINNSHIKSITYLILWGFFNSNPMKILEIMPLFFCFGKHQQKLSVLGHLNLFSLWCDKIMVKKNLFFNDLNPCLIWLFPFQWNWCYYVKKLWLNSFAYCIGFEVGIIGIPLNHP